MVVLVADCGHANRIDFGKSTAHVEAFEILVEFVYGHSVLYPVEHSFLIYYYDVYVVIHLNGGSLGKIMCVMSYITYFI